MKNKYISFVALAAAALATSCASDDLAEQKQEQSGTRTVTLTASVNEVQTRVGMTKDNNTTASFYWHKGDAISVLTTGGFVKFTTTDADGTQQATFTGEVTTETTVSRYAIYPYNANNFFEKNQIYYFLSAEYDYAKVESNIFSKDDSYPSNPTHMPMLGTITSGDDGSKSISFQCMGGLAVIRIDQMPAAKGTLTVTADQQLSGKFSVNRQDKTLKGVSTDTENDKQVTFNFSNAEEGKVGVFYLPLATGNYTNLKIVIAYGEDNSTTQTIPYGSLTVERAHVTAIPLSTDSKGNLRYIVKNEDGTYTINGHTFVDLGLSSGLLWAATNVGADTETAYGSYYDWDSATSTTQSSWGTGVRVPTQGEFNELISGCTGNWGSKDSTNGYTFTSKSEGNSNSIFLPAAGNDSNQQGSGGLYWSTTSLNDNSAYMLNFTNGKCETTGMPTCFCLSVRAVAEKP